MAADELSMVREAAGAHTLDSAPKYPIGNYDKCIHRFNMWRVSVDHGKVHAVPCYMYVLCGFMNNSCMFIVMSISYDSHDVVITSSYSHDIVRT